MKFLIHAGLPKTGSTAIQRALREFHADTHEFLDWGGAPDHNIPFVVAFDPKVPGLLKQNGMTVEDHERERQAKLESLEHGLDRASASNVILSAEAFSNPIDGALAALRDRLDRRGREYRVLLYVRPILAQYASNLQQVLRIGGPARVPWNDPIRAIRSLDDVFPGDVDVRLYGGWSEGGDVVSDFWRWAGIEGDVPLAPRENVGLSRDATALLIARARHGRFKTGQPGSAQAWNLLSMVLTGIDGPKLRLGPAMADEISPRVRDVARQLADRVGEAVDDVNRTTRDGDVPSLAALEALAVDAAPRLGAALESWDADEFDRPSIQAALNVLGRKPGVQDAVAAMDALLFTWRDGRLPDG